MDTEDALDVRKLELPAELQALGRRRAASNDHQQAFIKFPCSWATRLTTARRISTYRIALHLLYQHWRTSGRPSPLSNVALLRAGVSRREKWRALEELESAGLIKVERRPRKSPVVTILVVP